VIKVLVAVFAVVCALSGVYSQISKSTRPAMTSRELNFYGPEVQLPPSVVILGVSPDEYYEHINACGSAVLVDSYRGLYLTAFHVIEDERGAWIIHGSDRVAVPARSNPRWVDVAADLAVVQVRTNRWCKNVPAVPLASGPPDNQESLRSYGYHPVFRLTHVDMRGFAQVYTVLKSESDGCIDPSSCLVRDLIEGKISSGMAVDPAELEYVYPRQIYGLHDGASKFGLRPGMSGGPLVDQGGFLVGIARAYATFDASGKYGFFAPAYMARQLIIRAQQDISEEKNFDH